jgi:hypothetical protein
MKHIFISFFLLIFLACAGAQSPGSSGGAVEVSFTYARQSGSGSNQFAVWIEDAQGTHVKTLYATRFTATGGWERRPQSIPLWVKQSGLAKMTKAQIDTLTGATPSAGKRSYRWDGKNQAGTAVPPGEYRVFLEATLRSENRVLFSSTVQLGGNTGNAEVKTEYFGSGTAERGMIRDVTVRY